jgi:hypothetical protein
MLIHRAYNCLSIRVTCNYRLDIVIRDFVSNAIISPEESRQLYLASIHCKFKYTVFQDDKIRKRGQA